MLSTLPWTPKPEAAPRAFKLSKERRRALIEAVADVLRKGEPTRFAFESACRHGLRSALCLSGWPWGLADVLAAHVVGRALDQLGAKRPTWIQGQPEYTQFGVTAIERIRCINCGARLPEDHRKFCSKFCGANYRERMARIDNRAAVNARKRAWEAARAAQQPERPCEECGSPFRPKNPRGRFCSIRCRNIHNAQLARETPWGKCTTRTKNRPTA
ncbi:MAG TPA: hypothetical protein VFT69_10355 [Pseudolabrys sp.]|nr:hypothetical protein [Pseudolabrys sp.]